MLCALPTTTHYRPIILSRSADAEAAAVALAEVAWRKEAAVAAEAAALDRKRREESAALAAAERRRREEEARAAEAAAERARLEDEAAAAAAMERRRMDEEAAIAAAERRRKEVEAAAAAAVERRKRLEEAASAAAAERARVEAEAAAAIAAETARLRIQALEAALSAAEEEASMVAAAAAETKAWAEGRASALSQPDTPKSAGQRASVHRVSVYDESRAPVPLSLVSPLAAIAYVDSPTAVDAARDSPPSGTRLTKVDTPGAGPALDATEEMFAAASAAAANASPLPSDPEGREYQPHIRRSEGMHAPAELAVSELLLVPVVGSYDLESRNHQQLMQGGVGVPDSPHSSESVAPRPTVFTEGYVTAVDGSTDDASPSKEGSLVNTISHDYSEASITSNPVQTHSVGLGSASSDSDAVVPPVRPRKLVVEPLVVSPPQQQWPPSTSRRSLQPLSPQEQEHPFAITTGAIHTLKDTSQHSARASSAEARRRQVLPESPPQVASAFPALPTAPVPPRPTPGGAATNVSVLSLTRSMYPFFSRPAPAPPPGAVGRSVAIPTTSFRAHASGSTSATTSPPAHQDSLFAPRAAQAQFARSVRPTAPADAILIDRSIPQSASVVPQAASDPLGKHSLGSSPVGSARGGVDQLQPQSATRSTVPSTARAVMAASPESPPLFERRVPGGSASTQSAPRGGSTGTAPPRRAPLPAVTSEEDEAAEPIVGPTRGGRGRGVPAPPPLSTPPPGPAGLSASYPVPQLQFQAAPGGRPLATAGSRAQPTGPVSSALPPLSLRELLSRVNAPPPIQAFGADTAGSPGRGGGVATATSSRTAGRRL